MILDQINVHPNPEFNGGFTFNGSETGSDFVDFLVARRISTIRPIRRHSIHGTNIWEASRRTVGRSSPI